MTYYVLLMHVQSTFLRILSTFRICSSIFVRSEIERAHREIRDERGWREEKRKTSEGVEENHRKKKKKKKTF